MFDKYDAHVASQIFYMSQIGDYPFHQTFCFVCFGFDLLISSNKYQAMIKTTNIHFC